MSFCNGQTGPSLLPPYSPVLAAGHAAKWYAVYTRSRHEKEVARHLEERGLTYFLPLYQAVNRYGERPWRMSLPLFPGHVFVRARGEERYQALQAPGALRYVGAEEGPSPIADEEIEALRRILISGREVRPHAYVSAGRQVRIAAGPLAGLRGVIERSNWGSGLVVSVEAIQQSIVVDLDEYQVAGLRPVAMPELSELELTA